jgi:hypothetical protein
MKANTQQMREPFIATLHPELWPRSQLIKGSSVCLQKPSGKINGLVTLVIFPASFHGLDQGHLFVQSSVGQLHHDNRHQHEHNTDRLQRTHDFAQGDRRNHD